MGFLTEIENAEKEYERIKEALNQKIIDLPDNPRVTRLGAGNCFILNSKDLGNNWSAQYHDFKYTYKMLVDWISGMDTSKIRKNIQLAIKKGFFKYHKGQFCLHPEVIKHLKGIL